MIRTGLERAFVVVTAIFLLNDVLFIALAGAGYRVWLGTDWACRLLALAVIFVQPEARALVRQSLSIRPRHLAASLLLIPVLVAVGRVQVKVIWHYLPPYGVLMHFPPPDHPALQVADLLVGIPLVAFSEEVTARLLAWTVLAPRMGRGGAAFTSTLLFALFHWSSGSNALLNTALAGAMLLGLYRFSRSLWPPLAVHAAWDWISFS